MTSTALAQPEPQGPTDEEWEALKERLWDRFVTRGYRGDRCIYDDGFDTALDVVRQELARFGRPTIEPVPVSERLPGPEDCAPWPDEPDATPWCWAAKCVDGGWEWTQLAMLGLGSDTLGRIIAGGGWTHWAPHWALPVPGREP